MRRATLDRELFLAASRLVNAFFAVDLSSKECSSLEEPNSDEGIYVSLSGGISRHHDLNYSW